MAMTRRQMMLAIGVTAAILTALIVLACMSAITWPQL